MESDFKIYAARHMKSMGYGERIRFTKPLSKARAFKENGPMDWAVIERIIQRTSFGLALQLGEGLMVVDKDGPDIGPFAELESPMIANASRGEHLFFRTDIKGTNKIKYQGYEVDLLWNSAICIPPSETITGMVRTWKTRVLAVADLPLFPVELLKEEPKPLPKVVIEMPASAKIDGMRKWIRKVEAIEGSGGDRATFRVACKIVSVIRDTEAALTEIMAWNCEGYAQPPWTEKELRHKIASAIKYVVKS